MPGVFSQYRIGRDYLYLGSVTVAASLVIAALALLPPASLPYMFVSTAFMGLGVGFIFAALLFEVRMRQFERMANNKPPRAGES